MITPDPTSARPPIPVPFPGDALAEVLPGGGWRTRNPLGPDGMPEMEASWDQDCHAEIDRFGTYGVWRCTRHIEGWHIASDGQWVLAVWPTDAQAVADDPIAAAEAQIAHILTVEVAGSPDAFSFVAQVWEAAARELQQQRDQARAEAEVLLGVSRRLLDLLPKAPEAAPSATESAQQPASQAEKAETSPEAPGAAVRPGGCDCPNGYRSTEPRHHQAPCYWAAWRPAGGAS